MAWDTIVTLVLISILIIAYFGGKIIHNKHAKDPLYQQKMEERAKERKRIMEQEADIDKYIQESESDYE